MSLRRSLRLLWCGALLGASTAVRAQCAPDQLLLAADRDNTLYQDDAGALSNGVGQHLFTGNTAFRGVRRALLHFDAGVIPAGSIIGSATLWLDMSMSRAGSEDVGLHAVSSPWGEGTSLALGQEGGGAPSTAGDATWLHGFYDTDLWIAPGGDFATAASATATVSAPGPYSWASTAMVTDVQSWLDDPAGNHGWILVGNEADILTAMRFGSRENSDPAAVPVLCVGLREPVPIEIPTLGEYSLLLLALSLAGLALRRTPPQRPAPSARIFGPTPPLRSPSRYARTPPAFSSAVGPREDSDFSPTLHRHPRP